MVRPSAAEGQRTMAAGHSGRALLEWARASRWPSDNPLPIHVSELQRLASEWRRQVESQSQWISDPTRPAAPGEAGGIFVRTPGLSYLGYLKPTKIGGPNEPRAANEKIVADLAVDLDVPVPPVLLVRRDPCPSTEESRACVSLVMHAEVYEWQHVSALSGVAGALTKVALARCSGIVAFDTFVGNTDRNNGRNALFGIDPEEPADATFVFIDHAFSLNINDRWSGNRWTDVPLAAMPDHLRNAIDKRILRDSLDRIEALADDKIEAIVRRVPDDYMTPAHREVVETGLKARRSLVRPVVAGAFGL